MQPESQSDIVKRLDRLERHNRHLRWLVLLLPVVALAIGAGANGDGPTAKSIVAEEFVLKDKDGKERASLRMVDGIAALFLRDGDGDNRIMLQAGDDGQKKRGPGIFITNGKREVARLYHENGEAAYLSLSSSEGKQLVYAGLHRQTGGGAVFVNDRNGTHSTGIEAKAVK